MDETRLGYLRRRARAFVDSRAAARLETSYADVEAMLVERAGLLLRERQDPALVSLLRRHLELSGPPLPFNPTPTPRLVEGVLALVRDASGWRHVLNGRPVPTGTLLELQGVREVVGDTGPRLEPTDEWVLVRYEAQLGPERSDVRVTLHSQLAGHAVQVSPDSFMRFRWPEQKA